MPGKFARCGGQTALSTIPLDTYLALCTTAPTPDALGAELAVNGYVRRPVRRTAPSSSDPPAIHNSHVVIFGPFPDGAPEVGWLMMMDAPAGGTALNMLAFWELDDPRRPAPEEALILETGALELTCS